jgi:PAS domain S-box-containing protein
MKAVAPIGNEQSRETADALRLAVDTTPALIHTARPDGYLDYFNRGWLDFLGKSLEEVRGWRWTDVVHPEDVGGIVRKWQDALETGEPFEWEARVRRADGEYRLMLHSKRPLRDENGTILKWFGSSLDIQDRRVAEDQVRRIVDATPALLHSARPDGYIDFVNKGWLDFVGLTAKEMLGWEWTKCFHPDDRERTVAKWGAALSSGEPFEEEARVRRADGVYRMLLHTKVPLRDQAGRIINWYGSSTDIEDRKRAEATLRQFEFYLEQGQLLSHCGSWSFLPSGEFEYLSPQLYKIFGFDPSKQWALSDYIKLVHPDDRKLVREILENMVAKGVGCDVTKRLVEPAGDVRVIRCVGAPASENGKIVRFVGTLIDITEQEQITRELRRRDAYLAQAQALSHTGSFGWNVSTGEIYWSDETFRIFELERKTKITVDLIVQRTHPDDRQAVRHVIERASSERTEFALQHRLLMPDGSIKFLEVVGRPLTDERRRSEFVGAVTDITGRKRAETLLAGEKRVLEMIATGTPLKEILNALCLVIEEQRPGTLASVLLLNPDRVHLDVIAGPSLPEEWTCHMEKLPIGPRAGACGTAAYRGSPVMVSDIATDALWDVPEHRAAALNHGLRASWSTPVLSSHGNVLAAFCMYSREVRTPTSQDLELIEFATHQARLAIERDKAFEEIKALRDQLQRENIVLREELGKTSMFEEVIGTSLVLQMVLARAAKVAPTDSTVLIMGETGTGKELVARAIHKRSNRSDRPFISVNCAAVPSSLIMSELFGHEKGAFTGALQRRLGKFELAEGGTIFLDEVGDLPTETQIALLRVLQEREFERVGGTEVLRADVRVISATNRDLQTAIADCAFRSDLYYRLNVFPIELPPLRERKEDVPLLVNYFVDRYAKRAGKKIKHIQKKTLDMLQAYSWPGNVRELQNVIERSLIIAETSEFSIDKSWVANEPQPPDSAPTDQRINERKRIEAALTQSSGKVSGAHGAAAKLGMPPSTLESKIRSLRINKFQFKAL